jgi:hypothetical protein
MGHHFRERERFVQSEVSRRSILKGMLSGATVGVPELATAEAVPDETQLDACIDQLRNILAKMHPKAVKLHAHLARHDDGSFRFTLQGDVKFGPFEGDGIYLVSVCGSVWEYLVREERVVALSGRDMGYSHYYGRARADDGGWDHVERFLAPKFVRKIGEAAL